MNNNINNMQLVRPIPIQSPISGNMVHPRIHTIQRNGQIITEAHWIDPNSGAFIRKGIVSIEPIKK